jgi:DNA-binding NtrC family response regulator
VESVVLASADAQQAAHYAQALREAGYVVYICSDMEEVLERVWSESAHVLIAEYRLPDVRGTELLRAAQAAHRDIAGILLCVAEDVGEMLASATGVQIFRQLASPCEPSELLEVVGLAMHASSDAVEEIELASGENWDLHVGEVPIPGDLSMELMHVERDEDGAITIDDIDLGTDEDELESL